jgi:hypothetical protein
MTPAKLPDYKPGDPVWFHVGRWLTGYGNPKYFGRLMLLLVYVTIVAAGYVWGNPLVLAKIAESRAAAEAWVAIAEGARRDHASQNEALGLLLKNELASPST